MKKLALAVVAVGITVTSIAQDKTVQELMGESGKTIKKDESDTTVKIWKTGGMFNITLGQTSLTNWAAGGDQFSLNSNGLFNAHAFYKKDRHSWDNSIDLELGYINSTSLGTRKTNDRIDAISKYGYLLFDHIFLTGLFNFRSQFTQGYTYPNDTTKIKTSNFLAPAYVIVAAGLDWKPSPTFSLFLSPITSRWVIVNDDELSAKGAYGVDSGKTVRNEVGAYLSATVNREIIKNLTYKAKFDLFSNYKHNPQNIDLFMTNLLSMNVYKGFGFNIGADFIYDDDQKSFGKDKNSARLQVRQFIGIGYQRKF
ncbi:MULTISPECIES: DUF3078 domain-containing protein [Niastella]|uniref:DUF3078 domain-containing protein n=1 Tax=Niastella soli TaxID=2821487 RepID=A0ABS3YMN5_9BACT|nr:DUF3078 domain-containing protein [Niastella soli]MBO9199145.1 DUF3078 domain-containing protein [Niastella soli]